MALLELVHTETKVEKEVEAVEVEFPIYCKRGYDGYTVYTKINEDKTAIELKIVKNGEPDGIPKNQGGDWWGYRSILSFITVYDFEVNKGLDYCLGRGKYELSKGEFIRMVKGFRDFANRVMDDES